MTRRPNVPALLSLLALSCVLALGVGSQAIAETEIDESYIDAVREFLSAQNAANAVEEQMTFSAAQQAFGSLQAQGIPITEAMQAIIIDEARTSFGSKFSDIGFLAKLYAPVYQTQLSEAELRELSAFWKSPIGVKLLSVNPALLEGTLAALQEASLPFLAEFQQNVDSRFASAGITQESLQESTTPSN